MLGLHYFHHLFQALVLVELSNDRAIAMPVGFRGPAKRSWTSYLLRWMRLHALLRVISATDLMEDSLVIAKLRL